VKSVDEIIGMKLDGCFIGACTTAEEDLVLGALVLEVCLEQGMKPESKGQR
jgi:homoaconitate hydratase